MDDLTAIEASNVLRFLKTGTPSDGARIAPPDAAIEAQREAEEVAKRERIAKVLPPGISSVVLGTPDRDPVIEYVEQWFATANRGLVIRGGVGSGKSIAAGYGGTLSIRTGRRSVSWMRPNQFVSAVLHDYDPNAPKLGTDLVIIDDCGRETKADFCEALCAFIDDTATRFIITTNMQKDVFKAHYDERLIDRLNHVAKAFTVKTGSRRRRGDF